MPHKMLLLNGALVAMLAYDYRVHVRNKANLNRVQEVNADLQHQLERHLAQISYLCKMIDKHETPFDEFDLIALNDPM